jgi:hypothetical protein
VNGRDFASEIENARCDPSQLRRIADEIQATGGPRVLVFRAIELARAADTGPHPLGKMSADLGLPRPIRLPLYRYKLGPGVFERIENKLSLSLSSELLRPSLAPAFVVWAADWFRRSYQGGVQRWSDIENVLRVEMSQSEWRGLTDRGFKAWGIEPLITFHGNQRLSNLARHGGFPAAAISSGLSWPRRFLERVVGELLGIEANDIGIAIAACERNEHILPAIWRSHEMHAICGELALKIVELRAFADEQSPSDGRPYSTRLDEISDEWRDELPMMLDGAANGLIDTLLESRRLIGIGSIRVARMVESVGNDWRECLYFYLDGRWDDREQVLSPDQQTRVFIQPSGALADRVSSRLAYLEHEANNRWISRSMRSEAAIQFPFELAATGEFHSRGERLAASFTLPGGKPVPDGLRVFERRVGQSERGEFVLIGQGSGGYRADPVFIDVPDNWSVQGKDDNCEIEGQDFILGSGRRLYRCSGNIIARKDNGDTFLVRTGQSADRKDRLSIVAVDLSGVSSPDGSRLIKHPMHAELEDGLSRRVASLDDVCWRFAGSGRWRNDLANAGPGLCEFAWIDEKTGHLRDRQAAYILPAAFEVVQQGDGTSCQIQLIGWYGSALLNHATPTSSHRWKVRIDPPHRAMLCLCLATDDAPSFELNVPLKSKAWLTTWSGELLRRDTILGLADLRDAVARVPSTTVLMADISNRADGALHATWKIEGELGLSALRMDIAALMRPLGIDAQVRLDFHNGSDDYWYVTEFGNELEREPMGGLRPRTAIVGSEVRVCGRCLGSPEKEIDFGFYDGLHNGFGGRPIQLPRLRGQWLIYLREGARVLTRPKFVAGEFAHDAPQHKLGRAMAQPYDFALADLQSLVEEVKRDPTTLVADETIQAVVKLATSLNGLPPQTFEIFEKLECGGALAPLMLYRCEEQFLSTLIELFDGLCSSWSILPVSSWHAAFEAQGKYLMSRIDEPHWVLTSIFERQNEIAALAPQLAPLICRDYSPVSWDELRTHFTEHTSEGINTETGGFNPFRPAFGDLLAKENFAEALMRIFDAPFAAALAARGVIELDKVQILTVKDVERRHPVYFAKAFGFALMEIKNGR